MEFESLDEVVAWAKDQIDAVQKKADEEVIRYRLEAENATRKLNEELDQAYGNAERAKVRRETEQDVKASLSSQVASLELDISDLRASLAKSEAAAKKREKELVTQRDEALSQLSSMKRETMNMADLKAKAEKEREKFQTKYEAASEALAASKAQEEKATSSSAQLQSEIDRLTAALRQETAAKEALEMQNAKLQAQLQLLTNSMAKAINDRDAMSTKLKEAEFKAAEYESATKLMRNENAVLQQTARELAIKAADLETEARRNLHAHHLPPPSPAPSHAPPSTLRASLQGFSSSGATPPPPDHASLTPGTAQFTPSAASGGGGGGFGLRSILAPIPAAQAPASPSRAQQPASSAQRPIVTTTPSGRSLILQMAQTSAAHSSLPPLQLDASMPLSLRASTLLATTPPSAISHLKSPSSTVAPMSARGSYSAAKTVDKSGASSSKRPLSSAALSREERLAAAMRLISRSPLNGT